MSLPNLIPLESTRICSNDWNLAGICRASLRPPGLHCTVNWVLVICGWDIVICGGWLFVGGGWLSLVEGGGGVLIVVSMYIVH